MRLSTTSLEVIYLHTISLKPDPRNPRVHTDKQVRQIAQSIESFGFNVPLLIDDEQKVIAGHGRLLAARRLGRDTVPAIKLSHLTESQRMAFLIADNRLTENSSWDERMLGAHGYCKRNPAADFKPADVLKSAPKTNYSRIDAKDLPGLLRAIEVYQGTPVTRLAIKLMAMTFVRTSELIGARWSEFDLEAKRWDILAERMKMRTPHIVPLSSQAIEVLDLLRPLTGKEDFLFPGDRDLKKPMSNNTILKALERMGYKGRMTGHGFRGVASTILHEQGFEHAHIELQLAHSPRNAVSAAYNHALYLEPRARMMQEWADFLEHTQRGGKVLPFRGSVA